MQVQLLGREPEPSPQKVDVTYIQDRGACKNDDPTLYDNDFDYYDPPSGVKCPRCPIMKECLEYALLHKEYGVWGNTTERQRRALGRPNPRVHCPSCGSTEIEMIRNGEVCIDCGTSWLV